MASSFEKSVKGATKIKLAAPKSKYVEHILVATHAGDSGVAEIFRALQNRLRDSTWTIVFKSLIIVHLMIREGEPDVTLKYLSNSPRKLAISNFSDVQVQGRNIRYYSQYLQERAKSFGQTKVDYVRSGEGRLKRISVEKGLLRETECVQDQIEALLKCDLLTNEPENEITLTAYRLLTMDLLVLFHVMNEGTINVLEHYFEMSKYDAERALGIYRTFSRQTNQVVEFLGIARLYETATRLEIPKLKHAPTGLTNSLEEYLNDPDFELNRRQYLAEQEAKKGRGGATNGSAKPFGNSRSTPSKAATGQSFPSPKASQATPANPPAKGPAPDLIDFFDSIEQNQQPVGYQAPAQQTQLAPGQMPGQPVAQPFQQPVYGAQQTGQVPQQLNPALAQPDSMPYFQPPQQNATGFVQPQQQPPAQQDFTGANLGAYTPQQQQQVFSPQQAPSAGLPQNNTSTFQQPPQDHFSNISNGQQQASNPFRQSMMPNATGATASSFSSTPSITSLSRQPTNPFAKHTPIQSTPPIHAMPFSGSPQIQASQPQQPFQHPPEAQPLQPSATGMNPFAKAGSPAQTQQPFTPTSQAGIAIQQTGSTNPFRQSVFHNQQTGQSWQAGQGTMGGLEQLPTVPIFPRPGQQPQGQLPQQQPGWS